jgi:outer membrane protein assembly factor BamB
MPFRRSVQGSLAAAGLWLVIASAAVAQTVASISVLPKTAPPTTTLTVKGAGFAAGEAVDIYFDQGDVKNSQATAAGLLPPVAVAVPAGALPGQHSVTGIGQTSGARATKLIQVRTDWPMLGFSPQRLHDNPYENVLGVGNVPSLGIVWTGPTGSWLRSSPAVAGGVVYVGCADFNLYAFNATNGRLLWKAPTGNKITSTPTVVNGLVYVGSWDNSVYAFNAATGAKVWSAVTGNMVSASPVVVNGILYVASSDNTMYAYNAASGALVWSASIGVPPADSGTNGPTLSNGEVMTPIYSYGSAAVVNNVVYVGSGDESVHAFNAATGAVVWTAPTGNWVNSTPAVTGGVAYVGSWDGNFYAFNAATGAQLWATPLNGVVVSSAAVVNGTVYIGSADHNLYALDPATGAVQWKAPTGDVVGSSPAVANGVVFVGSFDDTFYAFNAATGAKLWSYLTPFFVEASPAVANGIVYFTSMNGKRPLYAASVNGVLPPAAQVSSLP